MTSDTHDKVKGIITGKIKIGKTNLSKDIPKAYWMHSRGPIPAFAWTYQRWHGTRWYKRKVAVKVGSNI
ncbi:hypothetical protein [Salicibibacter kimchii]|uniref:Uncharacterized protein n=1 Tax=Salicibibacter kimchii TaxID=2099786 RepID=A0A345C0G0_9BACI|nr:hypothetical protein [Salicibibacter kimchii]AXF56691.1 hypothetical protein DT065_12155 [Salicibibacter kimchii]